MCVGSPDKQINEALSVYSSNLMPGPSAVDYAAVCDLGQVSVQRNQALFSQYGCYVNIIRQEKVKLIKTHYLQALFLVYSVVLLGSFSQAVSLVTDLIQQCFKCP